VSEAVEAPSEQATLERLTSGRERMLAELRKVIVGQDDVIESLMIVLLSGSHCLLTGAPGLAKTLLIRTIARILQLDYQRIQFTPDLMPADILGTEIMDEDRATGRRELRFVPGPVFCNILLADEINRTPPKTQAALLEAMEERQVTIGGQRRPIEAPFFVLATQNPIELEGTFPLPEAQLDRFLLNVRIDYLSEDEELDVVHRTTGIDVQDVESVFTGEDMRAFARLVRTVHVADPIARYAVRLAQASRPTSPNAPAFISDWVSWGAGTRGSQSLLLAAKGQGPAEGSRARLLRRHSAGRSRGATPPHSHQLPRRRGAHRQRPDHRRAARHHRGTFLGTSMNAVADGASGNSCYKSASTARPTRRNRARRPGSNSSIAHIAFVQRRDTGRMWRYGLSTIRLHVTGSRRSAMSETNRSKSSRDKVRAHRERLRQQGLRPIQIWVPDVRSRAFKMEAHRQSAAVAQSAHIEEDQTFIDAVSEI